MFGITRLLLAILVLYLHAWGLHAWTGAFAVLAFFTLSGYLMTLIVHGKYGSSGNGLARYTLNRGLRIFPAYWFALALTLGAIWLSGDARFFADHVYTKMLLPESVSEWLATLFVLGQWTWLSSQLIPQAWALNIELIYYLAIPLFIGRRKEYALACFVTSMVYTLWVCSQHLPLEQRYFLPISGMLPFSFGAVIYFYRDRWRPSAGMASLLVLVAFGHVFVYGLLDVDDAYVENVPLYLNVLLFGAAIWALADLAPPGWLHRLDDYCGRLSYPLYLNHFFVLGVLLWCMPSLPRSGAETFAWTLAGSLLLAALSWWIVERPVEQLRERISRSALSGWTRRGLEHHDAGVAGSAEARS